jgi:phosphoribosylanthranilate isomerase
VELGIAPQTIMIQAAIQKKCLSRLAIITIEILSFPYDQIIVCYSSAEKPPFPRNKLITFLMIKKSFIQIAGVQDWEEADLLVSCNVNYIGFPFRLDYHSEDIGEDEAAAIIQAFPPTTQAVLITYLKKAKELINLSRKLNIKIIQLHADVPLKELRQIKTNHPKLRIIKSLIIGKTSEKILLKNMQSWSSLVDAFLLDTFDPESGASGATGKTHDWEISRILVENSKRPVILAGGLTPANVHQAILTVHPAGVDVHSGVEDHHGRKDRRLVERFISEARKAFKMIENVP